ncbi:MAG: HAD family hydrolase [Clostridia bacterium]
MHPQHVVDVLRKQYRVGLLTNADNAILLESITKQGFLFDCIITSENAKANKPDPRIFHVAIELAGGSPRANGHGRRHFAEDIRPAQDMGMQTLWVKTDEAGCGGETCKSVTELREILQYMR